MDLKIVDLGLVDFDAALSKQKEFFCKVKAGQIKHALLFCRHHPVITLGRRADMKNILVSREELERRRIALRQIERGGDVTYHGPGQLTIYPIFNLNYLKKDIHWFLRYLERLTICALNGFGVKGERKNGLTGVWVERRKIASIGIAIRNWVTFHGLSVNIKQDDLINFCLIRPCGMDIMVTSVESEAKNEISPEESKQAFIKLFEAGIS